MAPKKTICIGNRSVRETIAKRARSVKNRMQITRTARESNNKACSVRNRGNEGEAFVSKGVLGTVWLSRFRLRKTKDFIKRPPITSQ